MMGGVVLLVLIVVKFVLEVIGYGIDEVIELVYGDLCVI